MTTYKCWYDMHRRCYKPKTPSYPRYGGVGVTVCERWHKFENFLADMGQRPEGATLDRYPDQKGNYEPGNCRWAVGNEQQTNQSNNRKAPDGELWRHKALRNGISPALLHRRVHNHGWSWERASTQSVKIQKNNSGGRHN